MKLNINGYEVDIKVKDKYSDRANKDDAMAFLNTLAIWAAEARDHYRKEGFGGLADVANIWQKDINTALDNKGFFDSIK